MAQLSSTTVYGDLNVIYNANINGILSCNGNQVYHPGNKPTLGELGGLPTTGGTMTGNITFTEPNGIVFNASSKITSTSDRLSMTQNGLVEIKTTDGTKGICFSNASSYIKPFDANTNQFDIGTVNARWRDFYINSIDAVGKLSIKRGSEAIKLSGDDVGNNNTTYMAFFESNGTTRQGFIGFGTRSSSNLQIQADSGNIEISTTSSDGKIELKKSTIVTGELLIGNIRLSTRDVVINGRRAMVGLSEAGDAGKLLLNYGGDYPGGVEVQSGMKVNGDLYMNTNKKVATEEYVNTKTKAMNTVFTKGTDRVKTITHNLGTTNYIVTCTSNSAERHVFWANKQSNTVEIKLDDAPAQSDIEVDILLVKN